LILKPVNDLSLEFLKLLLTRTSVDKEAIDKLSAGDAAIIFTPDSKR
jgi:hypothetical protein